MKNIIMNTGDMLQLLTKYAQKYREGAGDSVIRNAHMNDLKGNEFIPQIQIDAILTDFINFIGVCNGCDYAMYTSDLRQKENETID